MAFVEPTVNWVKGETFEAGMIGLAVILFAVAGLMVDHTSEQNARTCYAEIKKAVES